MANRIRQQEGVPVTRVRLTSAAALCAVIALVFLAATLAAAVTGTWAVAGIAGGLLLEHLEDTVLRRRRRPGG